MLIRQLKSQVRVVTLFHLALMQEQGSPTASRHECAVFGFGIEANRDQMSAFGNSSTYRAPQIQCHLSLYVNLAHCSDKAVVIPFMNGFRLFYRNR
jgi:hypothetical protein